MTKTRAERRGISIVGEGIEAHDLYVEADTQRLRQVLINIISNAVKYSERGDQVKVSQIEFGEGQVRISVKDRGPGIPEDKISALFQPFERLGAEHDMAHREGTGLGLAVSKMLIEAMGGTIGVESVVGVGSTFWVDLKITDAPPGAKPAPPPDEAEAMGRKHKERTILYVEDNLATIELVEGIFDRRPWYQLMTATEGQMALRMVREFMPDLILLDLHLPGLNGDEILQTLKHDPDTQDIPVVMLSADVTQRQVLRLKELGAAAYLSKPIRVKDLLRTLDEMLRPGDDFAIEGEPSRPAEKSQGSFMTVKADVSDRTKRGMLPS
jgi:CheY-like chemotaxis protein